MTTATIRLLDLPTFSDARGSITIAEGGAALPFDPVRARWIYHVPADARRGGHAHRRTEQLFVAVAGEVDVLVDDGRERRTVRLDSPARGLHVPPLVWVETGRFSPGAICLLLASTRFDEADYIRDRGELDALLVPTRG